MKDGELFDEDQEVKLTLVDAHTHLPPQPGNCLCQRSPKINESKPFQLYKKLIGGTVELQKLQISCISGSKGHNCLFSIAAEFVTEDSPLFGEIVYTLPIQVKCKSLVTKKERKGKSSQSLNEMVMGISQKKSELVKIMKKYKLEVSKCQRSLGVNSDLINRNLSINFFIMKLMFTLLQN